MNIRDMVDNIFIYIFINIYFLIIKKYNKIIGFIFEFFKIIKDILIWKIKV